MQVPTGEAPLRCAWKHQMSAVSGTLLPMRTSFRSEWKQQNGCGIIRRRCERLGEWRQVPSEPPPPVPGGCETALVSRTAPGTGSCERSIPQSTLRGWSALVHQPHDAPFPIHQTRKRLIIFDESESSGLRIKASLRTESATCHVARAPLRNSTTSPGSNRVGFIVSLCTTADPARMCAVSS